MKKILKIMSYLGLSNSNITSYQSRMLRLQLWANIWRGAGAFFVVILVIALVFAVARFIIEGGTFSSLLFKDKGGQQAQEPLFNIKDLLIGVSGLIAIFATAWRYKLHEVENLLKTKDAEIKERDSTINDSKRLDDQFAKAVELLKEDNDITVRRGGIYILKNLALKSQAHLQPCVDLLCSLNNWMSSVLQKDPHFFSSFDENEKRWHARYLEDQPFSSQYSDPPTETEKEIRIEEKKHRNKQILSRDVLKIMSEILVHYSSQDLGDGQKVVLNKYNLCGIDIRGMKNTSFVNWQWVNMQSASLIDINFDKSNLYGVDLSYSLLSNFSAKEAFLHDINLTGCSVWDGDFRCATLTNGKLIGAKMNSCKFQGASLDNANFTASYLENVQMQGLSLEPFEFSDYKSFYKDTTFDGSIFYRSCLIGTEMYRLNSQQIIYYDINDEWNDPEGSNFDVFGEYDWSSKSRDSLNSVVKRYLKGKDNLKGVDGGTFFHDDHIRVNFDFKSIGYIWAETTKANPSLKRLFSFTLDNDFNDSIQSILDEVKMGYEEKLNSVVMPKFE